MTKSGAVFLAPTGLFAAGQAQAESLTMTSSGMSMLV